VNTLSQSLGVRIIRADDDAGMLGLSHMQPYVVPPIIREDRSPGSVGGLENFWIINASVCQTSFTSRHDIVTKGAQFTYNAQREVLVSE